MLLEEDGSPTLYFSAKRDIAEGEEIMYDYGESDPERESLSSHDHSKSWKERSPEEEAHRVW